MEQAAPALRQLPSLAHLWMRPNPLCSQESAYRSALLSACPGLQSLDSKAVGDEERAAASASPRQEEGAAQGYGGGGGVAGGRGVSARRLSNG